MEFLYANYLQTMTQIAVDSNADLAENLISRDSTFQWVSSGYDGSTKTTITISFDETKSVSRIALLSHNLKAFSAYYNGATANAIMLTSGDTTTLDYATNSSTAHYFQFAAINCTSVSFDLESAQVAGSEKAIGHIVVSSVRHAFSREPSARNYKPKIMPKQIVHELSDGGKRIQVVGEKFSAMLSYKYLQQSERDSLYSVWREHKEFIFCPFGTTTAWDSVIFPCTWEGAFEFYEFSDDAVSAGFSGKINLLETPE